MSSPSPHVLIMPLRYRLYVSNKGKKNILCSMGVFKTMPLNLNGPVRSAVIYKTYKRACHKKVRNFI